MVRLRSIFAAESSGDTSSGSNSNEQLVHIDALASTIRDLSAESGVALDETQEEQTDSMIIPSQGGGGGRDITSGKTYKPTVECIYIDNDQFYSSDKSYSKGENSRDSNWKSISKAMKGIAQRGESFVLSMVDPISAGMGNIPVFAVADVSFWVLRDFGTCLMQHSEKDQNPTKVGLDMAEKHPRHKRALKTLCAAIDNYMRKHGFWVGSTASSSSSPHPEKVGRSTSAGASGGSHSQYHHNTHHSKKTMTTIFLYSKVDDRFDMATLLSEKTSNIGGDSHHQGRGGRRK